jgi:hypothetical protein
MVGNTPLSATGVMTEISNPRCHTAIAITLESASNIYPVYWNLIFTKLVPWVSCIRGESDEDFTQRCDLRRNTEVIPRIRAFMEASEERRAFLERKMQEQLEFFEAEKEHFDYKKPRRIIKPCY